MILWLDIYPDSGANTFCNDVRSSIVQMIFFVDNAIHVVVGIILKRLFFILYVTAKNNCKESSLQFFFSSVFPSNSRWEKADNLFLDEYK
jgi:hypothetical protein